MTDTSSHSVVDTSPNNFIVIEDYSNELNSEDRVKFISNGAIQWLAPSFLKAPSFNILFEEFYAAILGDTQEAGHSTNEIDESEVPWLSYIYENAENIKSPEDIYPIVTGFSELFQKEDYHLADKILASIDFNNLNTLTAVTILRTTYSARSQLPSWKSTLDAVKLILVLRGENSSHLLRGLQ